MEYLIGIDIGTSGTKTVLFDIEGNVISSKTVEYPVYQPQNGWAEQDPDDWWKATVETLKYVSKDVNPSDIKGLGLSGQMHGLVMLDENNKVIRPSIIWCDQRTAAECEQIEEMVGHDKLIEITANPALTGFTASKIMWVKNNEPENFKRCRHILLPKDYVRFKLTGEYATDVSDASGMQLIDVKNRCWSDEILSILDIDKSMLAKMYESCEISGKITKEASELTGLTAGTPVAAGAGDNASGAVGMGVVTESKAFVTIGTSGVLFVHTNDPIIDKKGRVHTFCCAVPGKWHVMGVTQAAGLSLNWFRNNLCRDLSYKQLDELAEKIPIGSNRLIYLPYLMGERTPHLDADARGVFFGLSAMHTVSSMARAIMEGVTFSLRDCLEVLDEMGVHADNIMACGGGGTSKLWRQMLADNFECDVKTITSQEGAALGAAILGGVCAGVFESVEKACEKIIKEKDTQTPISDNFSLYRKYYEIYKDLYIRLKDDFKKLGGIDNDL